MFFWHRGVVVVTPAQLHSTKPELRFCPSLNPACGASEIRDGEDLWQWSWLELRLNSFRWSTIPQKNPIQFNSILWCFTPWYVAQKAIWFCTYMYIFSPLVWTKWRLWSDMHFIIIFFIIVFEFFCRCSLCLWQLFQIFLYCFSRFVSYFLFFNLTYDDCCQYLSYLVFHFHCYLDEYYQSFLHFDFDFLFRICFLVYLCLCFLNSDDDLLLRTVLLFFPERLATLEEGKCFFQPDLELELLRKNYSFLLDICTDVSSSFELLCLQSF